MDITDEIYFAHKATYRNGVKIPAYFNDEQWEYITQDNIQSNRYIISTYGNIYDMINNQLITRLFIKRENSYYVYLYDNNMNSFRIKLSLLMMRVFNPIPNENKMVVGYRDGNSYNIHLSNLYWLSRSENDYRKKRTIDDEIDQEVMRQAQYRKSTGIVFPAYFEDEIWTEVTEYAVPNIQPWYMVSSRGRFYSKLTNLILQTDITNSGYERIQFRSKDNTKLDALVHRVMMMCFYPIPNPEEMQVNHKDTIRTHNELSNLEWTTQEENINHARYEINLREGNSRIDESIVHVICKGLEDGINPEQIAYNLGISYPILADIIRRIKTKRNWKNISDLYNI